MKMTKLSIIAASAILGSSLLFTGCGSSDSTTTAAGAFVGQASVVSQLDAGALTVTFTDTNNTCVNNKMIKTTGKTINFALADLNASASVACTEDISGDYLYSVNTALSSYDYNTSNVLGNKVGPNFKGGKGKKVNVFSTKVIENGGSLADIVDIDVNTNPAIKALKDLIQAALATGADINTVIPNDLNLTAMAAAPADANITTLLGSSTLLTEIGTALGITLTADSVQSLADLYETNSSATLADSTDGNITSAATQAATAATSPKLNVTNISLAIGDDMWSAASNDFTINKAASADVNASADVVLSLNAAALNDFNVSGAILKAKVTEGSNELCVTLTGVSLATSGTNVSATVAEGSTLTLSSTDSSIASVSGTLNEAMTTSDLSFSLNDLIAGITSDTTAIAEAKADIVAQLSNAGTYAVTVGISDVNGAITNLEDVNSTLEGYKGFTGTVNVTADATDGDDNTTTGGDTTITLTSVSSNTAFDALSWPTEPPAVPATTKLVTGMVITENGTGSVTVSFDSIGSDVIEYKLGYATTSDSSTTYTDATTETSVSITGLTTGTTYQILVRSYYLDDGETANYKAWNYVNSFTAP